LTHKLKMIICWILLAVWVHVARVTGSTNCSQRETAWLLSVRIDWISSLNAGPVHVARDQLRHVDRAGRGVRARGGWGISTVDLTRATVRLLTGQRLLSLLLTLVSVHEVTVPASVF